jgi:hypothetical protein
MADGKNHEVVEDENPREGVLGLIGGKELRI